MASAPELILRTLDSHLTAPGECRPVAVPNLARLRVTTLGPLDLITSKLARGDREDLADIAWLIEREKLTSDTVRSAARSATVPAALAETFPAARDRLFQMLVG